MTEARVAVVGAGIAGLACATSLRDSGHAVTLFEKGRAPGGRVATRRVEAMSFDHGAQFATARGESFAAALAAMQAHGVVAPWSAAGSDDHPRFVGVPGMSAIPRHLALGHSVLLGRQVGWLAHDGTWTVRHLAAKATRPGVVTDDGDAAGPFDAILLALPAPQAETLLRTAGHPFAETCAATSYSPNWTVTAAFDAPLPIADVVRGDGMRAWMAREGSRPGRDPQPERWVIQASGEWSAAHLERPAEEVATALLAGLPVPRFAAAHRWRHAKVEIAAGVACLWDPRLRLGACGDWCLGGRIEAAWDSGTALGLSVAGTLR